MKPSPVFLRRVSLRNYMSIARCSVVLGPLRFLVGQNGAGKSNFLDALRFTADSLTTSVEHALRDRGGIAEVRRRSSGHPTHFGIELQWELPCGRHGSFSFRVGSRSNGGFEVQEEKCLVHSVGVLDSTASYHVRAGQVQKCSLSAPPPAAASDRLYLVAMSGQPEFRPIFDALSHMGFYNFNPDVIRELQSPDVGEVLAGDGRNLASVLKRLTDDSSHLQLERVIHLLGRVVPGINGVSHKPQGKKETLEFRQWVAGSKDSWRFDAENMSDGTLRALGVLVALFQSPPTEALRVPIVGIEEPETALHPGAAAVLRTALLEASRQTQIIVTSHSPDLLDDKAITEDMLLSVTSQQGTTLIGRIDPVSRSSIRDHLFTAGELLRLNQIETDTSETETSTENESLPLDCA